MTVGEFRETLNEDQRRYLLNALNLYREAWLCITAYYAKGGGQDLSKDRFFAQAMVSSGIYLANLRWLAEMLGYRPTFGNATSSAVVGRWKRAYEWMVAKGLKQPITYNDGTGHMVTLDFDTFHAIILKVDEAFQDMLRKQREGCKER